MAGGSPLRQPALAGLLGLALLLGVLGPIAAGGARAGTGGAGVADDVVVAFDEPRPGAALTGFTLVKGWAADLATGGPGIDGGNVQIWLGGGNGTPLGFAAYGWPRPDIVERTGNPGQLRTGFQLGWETCTFQPGDYHLVAYGWRRGTDRVGIAETRARVEACATPPGGELFADALADERSYWPRGSGTACAERYEAGWYWVHKLGPGRAEDCGATDNDATVFADFTVEVDARLRDPTATRFVSIGARHTVSELAVGFSAGYSVHLYPSHGLVRLAYDNGPEYVTLAEAVSQAVHRGDATNRIGVTAVGPRLRVSVNGQPVIEASDDRARWGRLMLGAGAPVSEPAEAAFRNLVVRRAP